MKKIHTEDTEILHDADDDLFIEVIPIPTKSLVEPRNGDGFVLELDNEFEPPHLAEFNGCITNVSIS